jgi:hypothetical protein
VNVVEKIIFISIFIVYFLSASGLYNSMDATQYFTAESLINNFHPAIDNHEKSPHYFVFPDIFYYQNHTFGARGFLNSFLNIPIHIGSHVTKGAFLTDSFPKEATKSPTFKHELSVTSFYVLYTVLGIYYLNKTLLSTTKNSFLSLLTSIFVAFGTYNWKYSSSYIRQGMIVFIIGFGMYTATAFAKGKDRNSIQKLLILLSLSYGIDTPLFAGILLFLCFYIAVNVFRNHPIDIPKKGVVAALLILLIQISLNYAWYGNIFSSQTFRQPTVKRAVGEKSKLVWISTPLYPTIREVLFSYDKIHPSSFRNFSSLPDEIKTFASLKYAKQYTFYGLFIVSPFLLYFVFSFLDTKTVKKYNWVYLFCLIVSITGIMLNSKVLIFWGGNQYDIRYFYPYSIPLAFLAAVGVNSLITLKKLRFLSVLFYIVLGLFSIFMGWLGVLNMYKPSLSGERKIWVEAKTANILNSYSLSELINHTFPNLINLPIALLSTALLMLAFKILTYKYSE